MSPARVERVREWTRALAELYENSSRSPVTPDRLERLAVARSG